MAEITPPWAPQDLSSDAISKKQIVEYLQQTGSSDVRTFDSINRMGNESLEICFDLVSNWTILVSEKAQTQREVAKHSEDCQ